MITTVNDIFDGMIYRSLQDESCLLTMSGKTTSTSPVIGQVKSRGEWTIIDRRGDFAKPIFDNSGYNADGSEGK